MPNDIRTGDKVIVVEGAEQGESGIVTSISRHYDPDDRVTRWTVWFDNAKGKKIKTRLAWVREL